MGITPDERLALLLVELQPSSEEEDEDEDDEAFEKMDLDRKLSFFFLIHYFSLLQ